MTSPAGLPDLSPGDIGPDARRLQERLQQLGYPVAADAVYGSLTKTRVEEFQQANGLLITGVFDSATRAALEAA